MLRFAPDLDPATQDVLTVCDGFIPTVRGYEAAPSGVAGTEPALASACIGAATVFDTANHTITFAGTATALYKDNGASWLDMSKSGGYVSVERWRFAAFGDVVLATGYNDKIQYLTASAATFLDIAQAPKAKYLATVQPSVVLAANTNDAVYGTQGNRWWSCDLADYTTWTPTTSNQAATGQLFDTPGGLTGVSVLGEVAVLWKESAIYVGQWVGKPDVWQFRLASNWVGTAAQDSIVNIGTANLFLGQDNFYLFDGTLPVPIGNDIKEWFFARRAVARRTEMEAFHDFDQNRVWWFYFSNSAGATKDSYVVYNYRTGTWGAGSLAAEVALQVITGQITYANIADYYATYAATIPAYGSSLWDRTVKSLAYFDATHQLKLLTGVAGTATLTTGDIGDENQYSTVRRVTPRFLIQPASATLSHYFRNHSGDALTAGATSTLDSRKRFDFLKTARWHHYALSTSGDCEITGFLTDAVPSGVE